MYLIDIFNASSKKHRNFVEISPNISAGHSNHGM